MVPAFQASANAWALFVLPTERAYELISLRTRPAAMSCDRPIGPSPPLLFTMVSSRAPCSYRAQTSSVGMPAVPKPPIRMVAPSCTSASASAAEAITLSSMRGLLRRADGRRPAKPAARASWPVPEARCARLAQRRGEVGELDQQLAGMGRVDDVLDHERLRAAKRRSERTHPAFDLRPLGLRVRGGLDLRLVCDLEPALDRQRTPLRARPGIAEAEAARMLVGAGGHPEGLADDHAAPGHRGLRD